MITLDHLDRSLYPNIRSFNFTFNSLKILFSFFRHTEVKCKTVSWKEGENNVLSGVIFNSLFI